jgi:lysyl-tRNA synthetase, class II
MSDTTGAAVDKVTEATANLHLDEVTGERVSKSELKKRQKQRQQEEKKREKAAAAPPKAEKKTSAEQDEANLTPNVSGTSTIALYD